MGLCVLCSEKAFKGWRCEKHYEQHKERPFYEGLVNFMTSSPVVALALACVSIGLVFVPDVLRLIGGTSGPPADAHRRCSGLADRLGLRRQPQEVIDSMQTVISKHVSLGIQPEQYPIVGECLMAAIGEVLGLGKQKPARKTSPRKKSSGASSSSRASVAAQSRKPSTG